MQQEPAPTSVPVFLHSMAIGLWAWHGQLSLLLQEGAWGFLTGVDHWNAGIRTDSHFQWGTFTFPQCCCWHYFQITGCTSFSPLPIPEEFISVSYCMFSAPFCLGFFILHGPSNCWDTQDCRALSVWAVGFPHLCWSLEGILTCLIFMRWLHLHYLFVTFRDAGKDLSLFEAGILQSVRKRETRCVSQRALILTWWFGFSVRTLRHAVGMGGRIV